MLTINKCISNKKPKTNNTQDVWNIIKIEIV